jgi:fibronectin-binding autotransporter adhesin
VDGSVIVGANGTLNVDGTLGTPTLNTAGATTLDGSATIGTLNLTGGTLTRSSLLTLDTLSFTGGTLEVPTITVSTLVGTMTLTNVLVGTVPLNIQGGTVTLGGDSTYNGGTTISSGTLVATHSNSLGTGTVTFGADGTTLSLLNNSSTDYGNDVVLAAGVWDCWAYIHVGNNGSGSGNTHTLGTITAADNNIRRLSMTSANGYNLTVGAIDFADPNNEITIRNSADTLTIESIDMSGNGSGQLTIGANDSQDIVTIGDITQSNGGTHPVYFRGYKVTFTGTYSYKGVTDVHVGCNLLINGDASAATGAVTQQPGWDNSLGGSGIIGGATTIKGHNGDVVALTPGNALTPGSLTFLSTLDISLANTSTGNGSLLFDLVAGGTSDKVILTSGALTIGVDLDIDDFAFNTSGTFAAGQSFTLFETTQTIDGTIADDQTIELGGIEFTLGISADGTDIVLFTPPPAGMVFIVK